MKVVQLITRLVHGGAQRVAIETAAFLRAKGHDVELWSGPETGPEGDLAPEARARGVPLRIFPDLVRAVSPWRDLCAVDVLARALRDASPDWLHTHSSKAGILGREAAHRVGLSRVAHTVHGFGFTPATSSVARGIYVRLERRAARWTKLLVFVSTSDLADAKSERILDEGRGGSRSADGYAGRPGRGNEERGAPDLPHVVHFPPAIDTAAFGSLEKLIAQGAARRDVLGFGDSLVVGFLGRLALQKNPRAAIESFRRLLDLAPATDARLLMVGDGPEAPALRGIVDHDPLLSGRVLFAGLQAEPIEWLAAMDLLLLPSQWEGAPLTLIEAMAAGRTVIASDLPGIAEYATDRSEAWLHPSGDIDEAARAMLALAESARRARMEDQLTELGAAARRRALCSHSREAQLEELLRLYATL